MEVRNFVREIVSQVLGEKYPENFSFERLEDIGSYAGKMKYAETHLQKLASGSARVVYKVDDTKVLKMAKNKKGLAQNQVEKEEYIQSYGIVAKVFNSDENDYWLEMEFAKKASKSDFQRLLGFSFEELQDYLKFKRFSMNPRKYGGMTYDISTELEEKMDENEFVQTLMSFSADYDMPTDDFERISSWGKVDRDGDEELVLVDFGLTSRVHRDYYMVS